MTTLALLHMLVSLGDHLLSPSVGSKLADYLLLLRVQKHLKDSTIDVPVCYHHRLRCCPRQEAVHDTAVDGYYKKFQVGSPEV